MRAILMSVAISLAALAAAPAVAQDAGAVQTEVQMLSGKGPEDAVPWDFKIATGRRAGEAATIPVPSNWQQQGFGDYQYGYDKGPRVADKGVYKRSFTVPAGWRGRTVDVVFDGVMTDATVKVNGRVAGPTHQGGFNRFRFDITRLVKFGEANEIEVEVSEASAAPETDVAERHGDYWVFGGIYRPVWLESSPLESVSQVAMTAEATGQWTADLTLRASNAIPRGVGMTATRVTGQVIDKDGKPVGDLVAVALPHGGEPRVRIAGRLASPKLWSAETPNLYNLELTLYAGDKVLHQSRQRFGFRTFEVRDGQGLYLNGRRVILKGVNRHSFRPDTGRALGPKEAYEDVRLMKGMNMNAVRMSHYAPEKDFLEAADELGLYVLDELSGWQNAHGTEVGRKLVRELVERDVNHPSILFWDNGNEGGWNRALDGEFWLYDPQKRTVLHPWDPYGGVDTKHYPRYDDFSTRLAGKMLVMPTELLHALYDGGGGAGLDDYWIALERSPVGAGGFLWNLADEGVARTDRGGAIDTYAAFAPDGLVGPRHEKEGSYYTVREVWSPVQVTAPVLNPGGATSLEVRNAYDFTSLSEVRFRWEWIRFPAPGATTTEALVLSSGTVGGPDVAARASGRIELPASAAAKGADALRLTALKGDDEILTWVWRTPAPAADVPGRRVGTPAVKAEGGVVSLTVGGVRADIDASTGLLRDVARGGQVQALSGGKLVIARPAGRAPALVDAVAGEGGVYTLPAPMFATTAQITLDAVEADGWNAFALEVSADGRTWKKVYDSARVLPRDGQTYSFPGQQVSAVRISKLSGVRKTPRVVSVKLSGDEARFTAPNTAPVQVTSGSGRDPVTGRAVAWVEAANAGGLKTARWTLRDDGELMFDYSYALDEKTLYHGVGFDQPAGVETARALVRGPTPVWQNRVRGPVLGVYDLPGTAPGLPAPQTAGYFADPQWVRLSGKTDTLDVATEGAAYLQVGQRLEDFPTTSEEFPVTTLGFMNAIPAMGAKSQPAEQTGPAGQPRQASGVYAGRLRFRF
jgi:hypothetical protein